MLEFSGEEGVSEQGELRKSWDWGNQLGQSECQDSARDPVGLMVVT